MYEADLALSMVSFTESSIDRCDQHNHHIWNILVTGHHLYIMECKIKGSRQLLLFSWKTPEWSLLYTKK